MLSLLRAWALLGCGALLSAACGSTSVAGSGTISAATAPAAGSGANTSSAGAWQLRSSAFSPGGAIPRTASCDGGDQSPPLTWGAPPAGTQRLALIVHDPDAPGGDFTHWVLFNIPVGAQNSEGSLTAGNSVTGGALQGQNGARKVGYSGPCPPPGPAHHYVFELYALDAPLNLAAGATRQEVETAMRTHILARTSLTGTYGR